MTENITLPPDLNAAIGSEKKDFAVKADRAQPRKNSISIILFGVVWTAITEISNVFEVEQICRKRIKENDPTPPISGYNIA